MNYNTIIFQLIFVVAVLFMHSPLVAQSPEDSLWDDRFGPGGGMNGSVDAFAVIGSNLYAGGVFATAGGASANHIAKWNGTGWSALGSGLGSPAGTDDVEALTVIGSDLYAGGAFATAGGISAFGIAKWDGTTWSALGSGLGGGGFDGVYALSAIGSDLYAGGGFTTAGSNSISHIAKWDGMGWSALGSGMDADVNALASMGSDLYAGGNFITAGGVGANYIAKWDGTSWSALGSGMNDGVDALVFYDGYLYAGGRFTTAGGISANSIAMWDGTSWSALGSGMGGGMFTGVDALMAINGDLYAGGDFITADGTSVNYIAMWDGTSWSALGSGMNGIVVALAIIGSDLYVGGGFTAAGGKPSNYIGLWHIPGTAAIGETTPEIPSHYALWQNFPNPFNPQTTLRYDVPRSAHVELKIFNIQGQLVRTLVDDIKPAGSYQAVWDGKNESGLSQASGIYFYRLRAENQFVETKRMLLLE